VTRLLFDENLSESLLGRLADVYPDSMHARSLGHGGAVDAVIWELAKSRDAVLVSRDEDFRAMSILLGPPPKVVWVNVGNARTARIATLLRASRATIDRLVADDQESYLALTLGPLAR
jgi:predicted nuclease of predicted toxin-antitoxin system